MTAPQFQLTGSLYRLTDYWYTLFLYNQRDSANTIGLQGVYFGDQAKLPVTPALCIDPSTKANNLKRAAANRALDPEIDIALIIYFGAVSSEQDNARQSIIVAEKAEALVHTKPNADGLVVHCHVTSVEAGYVERNSTLMRATRLNIQHKTRINLPS